MMKLFVLKSVVFSILCILIGVLLGYISNTVSPSSVFKREYFLREYLLSHANEIEALNVGSSHAIAVDLKELGYQGCDLWQMGMDLFEIKHQLETYVPKLPNLKTVFFCVWYASFNRDNGAFKLKGRAPRRQLYYAVIPSWKPVDGRIGDLLKGKLLPIARRYHWKGVFTCILHRQINRHPAPSILPSMLNSPAMRKIKSSALLAKHAEQIRFPYHMKLQKGMEKNHPNLTKDTYNAVAQTIKYLLEKNIRVIFYTPAPYRAYSEIFKKKNNRTLVKMKQIMKKLVTQYHIEYYDLSGVGRISRNNKLYYDSDHLNRKGTLVFTKSFKRILINKSARKVD